MYMSFQLSENVALVTASSGGLGKASAKVFAREDANVVINGRNTDALDDTVAELETLGDGQIVGV
jgi:3-oxoacyl-[acyl-carrier protein] reductase